MWNNQIPVNQIGMKKDDEFPVPQSKNKDQPHYQKPHKVGRPQQQFVKMIETMPVDHQSKSRKITPQQLALHNSLSSAWTAINGVVYDVTVYMQYHPGGLKLLQGCGKDGTMLFNQFHHWVNATFLLEKFRVGYLTGASTQKFLGV